jgi:hypothetical protein
MSQTKLQQKLKEIKEPQEKPKMEQADLAKLNAKVANHEAPRPEDTNFVSCLGWLSALSATIAAVAVSM